MKKRLISFLLVLVLVVSMCPLALAADANVGELKLVSGDPNLPDKDALVLLIMGDGFTSREQSTFYSKAAETADYIMNCAPFDEFQDTIKIYALGVASNQSGVSGAKAQGDVVDTYFGASYWTAGMDRLVALTSEGAAKGYALRDQYLPETDYCLYIVNSTVYGGSGGDYCVASLNTQSYDMMVHEMGHTIAGLSDEYYASGYEGEYANLSSDPNNVPWARFLGKNGIGVYDWGGNPGTGYYIPSLDCKMQYLSSGSTTYDFCDVCKEELRKAFCADSNVTKLFFQTYADEFVAGEVPDMRQYVILRKGTTEITGDKLGSELTLTYYDAKGAKLSGVPQTAGTYTVKASFAGDKTYGACSVEGTFEVSLVGITLKASSKVEDGKPADVSWDVRYDGDYYVSVSYDGSKDNYGTWFSYIYTDNLNGTFDVSYEVYEYGYKGYTLELAEEQKGVKTGPTEAAEYTVTVTVHDKKTGAELGSKSTVYTISTKSTSLLNNNNDKYYGATPYANNQSIIIYGEGFTLAEQSKFLDLAKQLMNGIMATEPFKETKLYFNVVAVNSVSQDSGIGSSKEGANDTFFRLTYDASTGKIIPSYCATYNASYLAYSFTGYQGASVVIVNGDDVKECATYYDASYDKSGYHMFRTAYVTPNDKNWTSYAAQEVLNYLTWQPSGYVPADDAAKEEQRLDLIENMYYEDTEYNACAPIIVSRAYDAVIEYTGKPVDLAPYFQVYRGREALPNVNLKLTYYDANGNKLSGAPTEIGEYAVRATTVPYDPDPSNPDESYWEYYLPEGVTSYDDALWLGMARGYTTFAIVPAGSGGGFIDVPADAWYKESVDYVVEKGLMNGVTSNTFKPNDNTSRAMLVTVLYRLAGSPESEGENPFTDVPNNAYYTDAVIWAAENGIVTGMTDTTFAPNAPVTRQQMAAILYRFSGAEAVEADLSGFSDVSAVQSYAVEPINWAVSVGLINGIDGKLVPAGTATRAQIATILMRFVEQSN